MRHLKQTAISPLLPTLAFLMPLFFLPVTLNFFATNKQALLILVTSLLLLASTAETFFTRTLTKPNLKFLLPLLTFNLAMLANIILIPQGKIPGLINSLTPLLLLSVLAYLISTSSQPQILLKRTLTAIIASGSLLAFYSILHLLVLSHLTQLPVWMQTKLFSPTGSILSLLTTLVLTTALTLSTAITENRPLPKTTLLILTSIQLSAIVAYLTLIVNGTLSLPLLPLKAGWSLTLDALKSGKTLLLGIGFANFPSFFTTAKPLFLNQTPFWNVLPQTSSTEFLHLLTTTGILGLLSFVYLLTSTTRLSQSLSSTPTAKTIKTALAVATLLLLALPANLILYTYLFIFLGLTASLASRSKSHYHLPPNLPTLLSLLTLTFVGSLSYFAVKVYAAEYFMRQAQKALDENSAQALYQNHTRAIRLAPFIPAYHTSLSQITLQLASAISQKQSLSEEDKQQITALIQQSIAEAKLALQLQPNNVISWKNLATIYRNLVNVAQNADQFAIQYYQQAIQLDPSNPALRVEFGGLLYQLSQNQPSSQDQTQQQQASQTSQQLLSQAIQQFQLAIQLKPDYANAYYNLSKALEKTNNIPAAYQAMQQVLANLDPDSPDYATAQSELKALEEKLPKQEQQPTTQNQQPTTKNKQLTQPSPLPSPIPGGPIELPSEEEFNASPSAQ